METERRIEKLLRAFAKKRRDQAGDPLQLHPAMRQQLQKEIARRSAATGGGGWFSSFFLGLRPKLVFAVCFVALAIGGWILIANLSGSKPASLASANNSREELASAKKTKPSPAPPVSTVAPPVVVAGKDVFQDKQPSVSGTTQLKQDQPMVAGENRVALPEEKSRQGDVVTNSVAEFDASTGVATASAAPSNQQTLAFKSDRAFGGGGGGAAPGAASKDAAGQLLPQSAAPTGATFAANADLQKALRTQAAPVASPPASAGFVAQRKNEIAAAEPPVSRLFLNRLDTPATRQRATDSLTERAPVLASFRVEQTGNAMRIIDADGSVYTGAVQVAQSERVTRAVPPKNAPPTIQRVQIAGQPPAVQNYFFRVAGTNRNLQQNVVFSGNLIPLTNASVAGVGGFGGAPAVRRELPAESLLSNSRISGKAVIGDQKEIEVIATPAP